MITTVISAVRPTIPTEPKIDASIREPLTPLLVSFPEVDESSMGTNLELLKLGMTRQSIHIHKC